MRQSPWFMVAATIGAAATIAAALPARADIYGYADSQGVMHYSNVPADPRYVVVLSEPTEPAVARRNPRHAPADRPRGGAAYFALIDRAARQAQVPAPLLRAMIAIESDFDPAAVSPKGAQGLMQLLPSTAARYGIRRPFDPAENLRGGARYLRDLLMRYGNDMELALAAYNAGEEAVDRYGRAIPPFAETRSYVPAVLELYRKISADMRLAWYAKTLPPST
jgi:soluble lytic murein transglycosylase-like protein